MGATKYELYNIAMEADKVAENNDECSTCFCELVRRNIRISSDLNKDFLNWKKENSVYSYCASVLFYLEDLGVIKILSGVANRHSGVDCINLKIKILHHFEGNKI